MNDTQAFDDLCPHRRGVRHTLHDVESTRISGQDLSAASRELVSSRKRMPHESEPLMQCSDGHKCVNGKQDTHHWPKVRSNG